MQNASGRASRCVSKWPSNARCTPLAAALDSRSRKCPLLSAVEKLQSRMYCLKRYTSMALVYSSQAPFKKCTWLSMFESWGRYAPSLSLRAWSIWNRA